MIIVIQEMGHGKAGWENKWDLSSTRTQDNTGIQYIEILVGSHVTWTAYNDTDTIRSLLL